jgi:hypothetical protein
MKPEKPAPLPYAILRNLPKTLEEADASIDALAALGLVTRYPDGTVGIAQEHLREAAVDAAAAIVRGTR